MGYREIGQIARATMTQTELRSGDGDGGGGGGAEATQRLMETQQQQIEALLKIARVALKKDAANGKSSDASEWAVRCKIEMKRVRSLKRSSSGATITKPRLIEPEKMSVMVISQKKSV